MVAQPLKHFLLFLLLFKQGLGVTGGELITKSTCTCPGYNVTYECSVTGGRGEITVWEGTAFDCANRGHEIILSHSRFNEEGGTRGTCNNGEIVGRSLRVEDSLYTSQLVVKVNSQMIGETIECAKDDGMRASQVGSITIATTTAPFPPPDKLSISFVDLSSRIVTLKWNGVDPDCPALHYNILASNCGSCPTITTNTTVTCTDVPTDSGMCTLAVQTVVCGESIGRMSDAVGVLLKGNSDCTGAIVSSSFFAIVLILCISAVIVFFLIKYKFKGKLTHLKQFSSRKTANELTYEDVRGVTSSGAMVDTNLTSNISYDNPSKALESVKCS